MRKRFRSLTFLLIGIFSFMLLILLIKSLSPTYVFLWNVIHISIIFPFFILLFLSFSGIIGFLLASKLQGIIIGIFLVAYLLVRLTGLTNWFFLLLMVLLFLIVELFLLKSK